MKKLIMLSMFILVFTTISCKNEKKTQTTEKQTIKTTNKIPFLGTWTRSFEMGKGVTAKVTYTIHKDSIQYEMLGPMNMNYTLVKDTFASKDNRWFGKRNKTPYVIFFKNISKDSITVLKMKVDSKEKALKMPFPSDTARSKFSSWNTFMRK